MKAIILAGGLGTRLRSISADTPKPMVLINSKPFLSILLDYLEGQGICEVILAVGYLKDKIIDYFGSKYNGISIIYSEEQEPLGTGGAILQALAYVNSNVFVINGDTFCPINYKSFYEHHLVCNSQFSIVLKNINNTLRYGKVDLDNGIIKSFQNKEDGPGLINCGIYLINKSIFSSFNLPKKFSFETDFMTKYVKTLHPFGFKVDNYFIDIGIPEDYNKFCKIMKNQNEESPFFR